MAQIQPQEIGAIAAGIGEGGQHFRILHGDDGAALHGCAVALAHFPENDNSARQHADSGEITGITADGDKTVAHGVADLVSGIAVDDDLAAGDANLAATIGTAHHMAGIALDDNAAARHFRPHPVIGVLGDDNLAARHGHAYVLADTSLDEDTPLRHGGAHHLEARGVTFESNFAVAFACDLEEIAHSGGFVAVMDGQCGDILKPEALHFIGTDGFSLHRHGGFLLQGQFQTHEGFS